MPRKAISARSCRAPSELLQRSSRDQNGLRAACRRSRRGCAATLCLPGRGESLRPPLHPQVSVNLGRRRTVPPGVRRGFRYRLVPLPPPLPCRPAFSNWPQHRPTSPSEPREFAACPLADVEPQWSLPARPLRRIPRCLDAHPSLGLLQLPAIGSALPPEALIAMRDSSG